MIPRLTLPLPAVGLRRALAIAALLWLLPAAPCGAAAGVALPDDSLYQLPVALTDQNGQRRTLDERRGHPVLISMFYTSCQFVCPMLVDALQSTLAALPAGQRQALTVLMVSFDPARDTVAVLKQTARARSLDETHWTLARADARDVRRLAAALGIQYRALPNGDFNHSTALILLDAQGRIAGQTGRLGDADPAFVRQVRDALATPPPSAPARP